MKKYLNNQMAELIVDTAVTALLSLSFAAAFFLVRDYDISFSLNTWVTLLAIILVAVFSRRWWLLPIIISATAASAAIVIWRLDIWTEAGLFLTELNEWLNHYWFYGEPESAWLPLFAFIVILPLCLTLFILVRRVALLIVYLVMILAIYVPLLIIYPDAFPLLLIALAALLIMMPRYFSFSLARTRPRDTILPRAPMQLLAIPVAIISLLLAQLVVPEDTRNWRWLPLVNRINDVQDLWQNTLGTGRSWRGFDIGDYGYASAGQQLGGPVRLEDRTVLRVRSPLPVLIRGSSRSIYTGYSWDRPAMPYYRFDSPLWQQIRRRTFLSHLPSGSAGQAFRNRYSQTIGLSIEHIGTFSTLFSSGRVTDIQTGDRLNYPPYFNESGDLFVFSALPRFRSYTQNVVYFDRNQEGFTEAMIELEDSLADRRDRHLPRIRETYLQLPADLPGLIRETALELSAEGRSDYERAQLIETYLKTNYTYSLDPVMPPEDEDFVAHFLETEIGYCVYYATAMVIMARTLDIPARYVEGFIIRPSQFTADTFEANTQGAHAWAELYFPGIGWLPFDATPAAEIPDEPPNGEIGNGIITPEPTRPYEDPIYSDPVDFDDQETRTATRFLWIMVAAALILLLARLGVALARYRHQQRMIPENVHLRYPNRRERLEYYYQDLLRQLACIRLSPEIGETLQQFARRVDAYLRLSQHRLPDVLWPVSRLRYGELEPKEDELAEIAQVHHLIEQRLKQTMNAMAYFFRRILR